MNTLSNRFTAIQSQGKRDYQEDEYGILDDRDRSDDKLEHTLIVIADGMGGHVGGARASALVTEAFIDSYQACEGEIRSRFKLSLEKANTALTEAIALAPDLQGMGSTIVAAVIEETSTNEKYLHWLSVGDSPLYLYRNGQLKQLNADHSMVPVLQDMVDAGKITAEQAAHDPKRHSLLSAVMGKELELIDLSDSPLSLNNDDMLLLSSDGLLSLSETEIASVLESTSDIPLVDSVKQLLKKVEGKALPQQDNITIALYTLSGRKEQKVKNKLQNALMFLGLVLLLAIILGAFL